MLTNDCMDLVFVPLGGVGEIGMNLALYGYGAGDRRDWLVIDFGLSFPGPHQPGVDVVFADIKFLEEIRDDILAIIITHGHEDHYGALLALWPAIERPLYCSAFVSGLLNAKAARFSEYDPIPANLVKQGDTVSLGVFNVEFIAVSHSIPEANALLITTPAGRVLHTGDWRLDPKPGIGRSTNIERLEQIGQTGGVETLICDSTNAMRDGSSPSEEDVQKNLTGLISNAKYRVAVTTFSSNVARIRAIALAAAAADRHVVLLGAAMRRVVDVSRELGFLDDVPQFISEAEYGFLPREKVVVLLTGTQGENRAALAKIARDEHRDVALSKGDLVIFSSRAIPGNEKLVDHMINQLLEMGIDVITSHDAQVHVTGHPRIDELQQMYDWVKPRSLIPVHGEAMHLKAHAKLARSHGIKDVMVIKNGDVVQIAPHALQKIDEIPTGILVRDGKLLRDEEGAGVIKRGKLSIVGVVSVGLVISAKGDLLDDPAIETIGLPLENDDDELIDDVLFDVVLNVVEGFSQKQRKDVGLVREAIYRAVRGKMHSIWGKKPFCSVLVMRG